MPTWARRWDVFPIIKIILQCSIFFAALHGLLFSRRDLLLWRRLILRQPLRLLGINGRRQILFGMAWRLGGLLRRASLRRRRRHTDQLRQ